MPLISTAMQGLTQAKAASQTLAGSKFPSLASAIASATCTYILASSVVNSTNVVMGPGAGTQVGRIVGVNPTMMSSLMVAKAAASGLAGKDISKLCQAVAFGVCNSLNTVVAQGSVIGGGPGSGVGKILGLVPNVLQGIILAQAGGKALAGSKISALAGAMAFGICTHIMTMAIVNMTDIGAAAPPPAGPVPVPTAPGIGRLV